MSHGRRVGTSFARQSGRGTFRAMAVLSVLAGLAVYLLSGVYVVKPEQQAVVVRCGKAVPGVVLPGTHYHLPYPVGEVFTLKPNEVKSVKIPDGPFFSDAGAEFITGDENIVHVALNIQYRVNDPKAYVFRSTEVDGLVRVAAEAALTDTIARTHVDDLLTSGKQTVLTRVKGLCQADLRSWNTGVEIISANFASVSPPAEVSDAFKDVASALEDKDRIVNEALGDQNQALHQARGQAHQTVSEAEALRTGNANRATGEAARFRRVLAEYRQSGGRDLTRARLYIEAMEKILPGVRKYLIDSPGGASR